MSDDELKPQVDELIEEEDGEDEPISEEDLDFDPLVPGKKKPKKAADEDESLEDLAEEEDADFLGDEDYNNVEERDQW